MLAASLQPHFVLLEGIIPNVALEEDVITHRELTDDEVADIDLELEFFHRVYVFEVHGFILGQIYHAALEGHLRASLV